MMTRNLRHFNLFPNTLRPNGQKKPEESEENAYTQYKTAYLYNKINNDVFERADKCQD